MNTPVYSFLELVKQRQSDRAYDAERPVEAEKLEYLLEATRLAPSACNAQPWTFVVVTDPTVRAQVVEAVSDKGLNPFAKQAPVFIVVVEENANFTSKLGGIIKQKHYPHMDLGIAAAHLTLAATEQGLGSCIVGWFNEKKLRECLHIPTAKRPVLVITLGYSTQPLRAKKRKSSSEVIVYNTYRKP
jgi:nitroreductase